MPIPESLLGTEFLGWARVRWMDDRQHRDGNMELFVYNPGRCEVLIKGRI